MNGKSLGKNALLNGIKTTCSVIFPFVSFSYCSRILGANHLGAYSFCQSIVAYLLLIAALGIPNYAIREGSILKNDKIKLINFINQIFTINCFMTIVSYVLLFILLIYWPKLYKYKAIILIQSVQIMLTTFGADWINTIYEDYLYLAIRYIIIQILSLLALIFFVKTPNDIYLYTFISMISNAGGNILNWGYLKKKGIKLKLTLNIDLKKHVVPILILFFNCIASTIYLNSDITMLGMYSSDSSVGIYTVSSKIYAMIKTLITSIIMVTLPRFSEYIGNSNLCEYKKNLDTIQNILIVFTLPIAIGLFIEGDKILNFVAGGEYITGTYVVKLLAIAIPFSIEACFFTYSILIPNREERYFLISTIMAAIINIVLNFILIPTYGIYAAAFTTLIAELVVMTMTLIYAKKIISFNVSIKNMLKILISCFSIIIVCLFIDSTCMSSSFKLMLDITVSFMVYIIVLSILKYDLVMDFIYKFKNR